MSITDDWTPEQRREYAEAARKRGSMLAGQNETDWRALLGIEREKTARLERELGALCRVLGISRRDAARLAEPRLDEPPRDRDD